MRLSQTLLALAALGCAAFISPASRAEAVGTDVVTVLTPAFSGDLDQGRGASYVLKLQIQAEQSLYDVSANCGPAPATRQAPTSRGEIAWIPGQLDKADPRDAQQLAILAGAQVIVWGAVSRYPDGVLVSPFVTVVDVDTDLRLRRPERQLLATPDGRFLLDHPQATQIFDPIFIPIREMSAYSYSNLKLCTASNICVLPGNTYRIMRALAVNSGSITLRYQQKIYHLSASPLASHQSRLVQYVAGLTAFLRGQPNLATCQFRQITQDETAPDGLRADASYYLGLLDIGRGHCPLGSFVAAYQFNDASFTMARALEISRHSNLCTSVVATTLSSPPTAAELATAVAVIRLRLAEHPDAGLARLVRTD